MKFNDLPRGVPCSAPGLKSVFCRYNENCTMLAGHVFEMGTGQPSHITELCIDPYHKTDFGEVTETGIIDQ